MIRRLIDWLILASWSEKIKDTNLKLQMYEAWESGPTARPPHTPPNAEPHISPFSCPLHQPASPRPPLNERVLQRRAPRSEAQHWKVVEGGFQMGKRPQRKRMKASPKSFHFTWSTGGLIPCNPWGACYSHVFATDLPPTFDSKSDEFQSSYLLINHAVVWIWVTVISQVSFKLRIKSKQMLLSV